MSYKQKINPRTGKFDLVGGDGDGGKTEVTSVDKSVTVIQTEDGVDLSVTDYVNKEKRKLFVLRVSGAKTSPKRFIEVNPTNGTAYYKLTAMVMGASGNPDYFGLLEVAFGYGRPGTNPNFCYAQWIAFTEGNPAVQQYNQAPEFRVWVSSDKQKLVIGAKCPADTYQTLELHIVSEEAAYGTVKYGTNSTSDQISDSFLSTAKRVEINTLTVSPQELKDSIGNIESVLKSI